MSNLSLIFIALLSLVANSAFAQDAAVKAEEREKERVKIEIEMREAEQELAKAARKIAELTQRNMPMDAPNIELLIEQNSKPRLGVTINSDSSEGPVDGVTLTGITPGSGAAEAGLRAGDVITAINGESLRAENSKQANDRLLDFMSTVEEGEEVDVEYLRDGSTGKVAVKPRPIEARAFVFQGRPGRPDGERFTVFGPKAPNGVVGPHIERELRFGPNLFWTSNDWSDMELVELSSGLGKYFGTDSGLLVVSVSEENQLKLKDGDVIISVDDREPDSVGHLMRILASYQAGESLELRIMRDKKRQTIELEMPAERTGSVVPPRTLRIPLKPTRANAAPAIVHRERVEIRT